MVCNSRAVSSARDDAQTSETGYHRCQGEARVDDCPSMLKPALEPPVRMDNSSKTSLQPEPGCFPRTPGWPHFEVAVAWSRIGVQSEIPGAKLVTYSTMGFSREHGNLDPSAMPAKPGKPPSPVMSRTRGGASVVVRVRESRAQGEGRQ